MFFYGKTAAHAIAVMSYLAGHPGQRCGSREIAEARGMSLALAAKLLTQLATAGLVVGVPGPHGGYVLARPARAMCLMEIVSLFEGSDTRYICPFGENWCGLKDPCPLHDELVGIAEANVAFLRRTTLAVFEAGPRSRGSRRSNKAKSFGA